MLKVNTPEFRENLLLIADGMFIRESMIWQHKGAGYGSDSDELISEDPLDPTYATEMMAYHLYLHFKDLCVNGYPHRMVDIPVHKECITCHLKAYL